MTTLQEAVQAFADKGMLMSIRRHNTEEVCFLKEGGEPLATSRSRRIQDLTFRSTPLTDRLIETDFILEYVPPISGLDHLWPKYRGVFHIVVRNITIHSSLVRDLSSEPPMDPGYDMMMHQLREDPHAVKEPVIYAPPAYQMTPEYLAARDYLMNAGMTREEATKELVDF
jgi:hypothetical protein